ncbi:MAG TPA: hypothetical protein VH186_15795 [Chloroflexia bacterium]|nr:hypothetical protein [Chloroflexia bacterium]
MSCNNRRKKFLCKVAGSDGSPVAVALGGGSARAAAQTLEAVYLRAGNDPAQAALTPEQQQEDARDTTALFLHFKRLGVAVPSHATLKPGQLVPLPGPETLAKYAELYRTIRAATEGKPLPPLAAALVSYRSNNSSNSGSEAGSGTTPTPAPAQHCPVCGQFFNPLEGCSHLSTPSASVSASAVATTAEAAAGAANPAPAPAPAQPEYDKNGYGPDGYNKEGYNRWGYDREDFDREGYDPYGFDRNGRNRRGYDRDGFDEQGFDPQGIHLSGFDRNGLDYEGFNSAGYDPEGYDRQGFNQAGLNRNGYDREGYHGITGLDYRGYDRSGYDANGYDANGYARDGYDRGGYDRSGYDRGGQLHPFFTPDPATGFYPDGYDRDGYGKDGYHLVTGQDRNGYGRDGYNRHGYDRDGYSISYGLHFRTRRDREGYDTQGFDEQGYDRLGYDRLGFDREGYTVTGYDRDGFDKNGVNRFGRDKNNKDVKTGIVYEFSPINKSGYARDGYDLWGFDRNGLTKDGRNYAGWEYDATAQRCYDPADPTRERSFSYYCEHTAGSPFEVARSNNADANPRFRATRFSSRPHHFGPSHQAKLEKPRLDPLTVMDEATWRKVHPYGDANSYNRHLFNSERQQVAESAGKISLEERYFKSEARATTDPKATINGVRLNCSHCGQFVGGAPHHCPVYSEAWKKNRLGIFEDREEKLEWPLEAYSTVTVYASGLASVEIGPSSNQPDFYRPGDDLDEPFNQPHLKYQYEEDFGNKPRPGSLPPAFQHRLTTCAGYDLDGYDEEGYDRQGYDRDGFNKAGYNREGFDKSGWDREGYDQDGYNRQGVDRFGNRKEAARTGA